MNILTFDIEEWFHILDHDHEKYAIKNWNKLESRVEEFTEKILFLLEKKNISATFFIVGWVAEKFPKLVSSIQSHNHEIASHSYYHQLCYELDRETFIEDTKRSISVLEEITGTKVVSYRAPGFSIKNENFWMLEILRMNGILNDCSVFSANRMHGGIQGRNFKIPFKIDTKYGNLYEFPMSYSRVFGKKIIFSGGGYFRVTPTFLLNYLFTKTDYNMVYIHPRDIDATQPKIQGLSKLRHLKHYIGLASCYSKIENLLVNEFMTVTEARILVSQSNLETVSMRSF